MSGIDLSYIAGLFDGEGYFGVLIEKNQGHPGLREHLAHTTIELGLKSEDADYIFPEIISFLPEITFNRYSKYRTDNWQGSVLRIRKQDHVVRFISMIKPFVRFPSVKRKIELIEKINGITRKYRRSWGRPRKIQTSSRGGMGNGEYKELLVLAQELRKLGKRGRGQRGKTDVGKLLENLDTQKDLKVE